MDCLAESGTAASGSYNIRYVLSDDSTINGSDSTIATFSLSTLGAGATIEDLRTLTIPGGAAAGWQYLGLILDSNNAVSESGALPEERQVGITLCRGRAAVAAWRDRRNTCRP